MLPRRKTRPLLLLLQNLKVESKPKIIFNYVNQSVLQSFLQDRGLSEPYLTGWVLTPPDPTP